MKLHVVRPPASDAGIIGEEPTWEGGDLNGKSYTNEIGRGFNWHAYCSDRRDAKKYIEEWLDVHGGVTTKKQQIEWKKVDEKRMGSTTIPVLARMQLQGLPLIDKHADMIWPWIKGEIASAKKNAKSTKRAAPTISVQDRMRRQVATAMGDLDAATDSAFRGESLDIESLREIVFNPAFKAPHLAMVSKYIESQLAEWNLAYNARFRMSASSDDQELSDQLAEGYSYVPKKTLKHIIDTFAVVVSSLRGEVSSVRVNRIRRKKPQDKKKVVSKLKYKTEDTDYNIKSITPVDILGATVLWVFDTKKRKLGMYVGEFQGSLFVKGTTIQGIGSSSAQKILRKPDEQLLEFFKLRKNQTEKWFGSIKAKGLNLRGRINADVVLLKTE